MNDWYQILDIERGADEVTIRRAYRRQALLYHPDKNPSPAAREKFQLIQRALEVLTSAEPDNRHQPQAPDVKVPDTERDRAKEESDAKLRARLRELSAKNTRICREFTRKKASSQSCRTVLVGGEKRVFDSISAARDFVDTHPTARLVSSYAEPEFSAQYEKQTLERAKRRKVGSSSSS